jgi:hypothetical protein
MKKITMVSFLVTSALALLLTGCTETEADKKAPVTKQEAPASTESTEESPESKVTVSPEHEKLIKDAWEQAKQGKQVPMNEKYKQVSWAEIEKVLADYQGMTGPEDGGSTSFSAGKYTITFFFNCTGKCVDSPKWYESKLVSMGVEEATP